MKIFNYHGITGDFLGPSLADKDIDPCSPTGWLIPANATTLPPPHYDALNYRCRFIDGEWVISSSAMSPEKVKEKSPEEIKAELEAEIRVTRSTLLSEADIKINILEDSKKSATSWRKYRQELRDITNQSTFPTTVVWPVKPT